LSGPSEPETTRADHVDHPFRSQAIRTLAEPDARIVWLSAIREALCVRATPSRSGPSPRHRAALGDEDGVEQVAEMDIRHVAKIHSDARFPQP